MPAAKENSVRKQAMNILYISYDGALDPLGSSQIIPYLLELSRKGINFTLLTYEKKERLNDADKVGKLKKMLKERNINWKILVYHKSPAVPATLFDIFAGTLKGFFIVFSDKIQVIHARSFVGALPALILSKALRRKFIFDMRGFWADERLDGNIWRGKGVLYGIAKWWERVFLINADWVVCLTQEAKNLIREFPYLKEKKFNIDVIPTCADTVRFCLKNPGKDLPLRRNLENRFIFVYFGSIGTWYMLAEMIDFFKTVKGINKSSFFMILTPDKKLALGEFERNKVSPLDYLVEYVPYEEIPDWLSFADASVYFIRPSYSKKSSCPTKFAESLACGLPVVVNSGIGDIDRFVTGYKVGVIIEKFCESEYIKGANDLFAMLNDRNALRNNCRRVAEDFYSLEKGSKDYWSIYRKVLTV